VAIKNKYSGSQNCTALKTSSCAGTFLYNIFHSSRKYRKYCRKIQDEDRKRSGSLYVVCRLSGTWATGLDERRGAGLVWRGTVGPTRIARAVSTSASTRGRGKQRWPPEIPQWLPVVYHRVVRMAHPTTPTVGRLRRRQRRRRLVATARFATHDTRHQEFLRPTAQDPETIRPRLTAIHLGLWIIGEMFSISN